MRNPTIKNTVFTFTLILSLSYVNAQLVTGTFLNIGNGNLLRTNNTVGAGISWNSIAGGAFNTNDAQQACIIAGGWGNTLLNTNDLYSTISGGLYNNLDGLYSVISGGRENNILKTNGLPTMPNDQNSGNYAVISGGGFNTTFSYNTVICGGVENTIEGYAYNSVISGGYDNKIGYHSGYSTISGGTENLIERGASWAAINGGYDNVIQGTIPSGQTWTNAGNGHFGWIGGGRDNWIWGAGIQGAIGGGAANWLSGSSAVIAGGKGNTNDAKHGVISGGKENIILTNAIAATVAGGELNFIGEGSFRGFIGGGYFNTIGSDAAHCNIVGGLYNTINDDTAVATILGGGYNEASGTYAMAGGYYADAAHDGSFVWSDSSSATSFSSTNNNEFAARTHGGVRFETGSSTGVKLSPGSGSWSSLSDRNAKENFSDVNSLEILEKVIKLPITTWNYKEQDDSVRHIGPVAQDFRSAFGLGEDDSTITSIDTDGVVLAAIQGLNEVISTKNEKIKILENRLNRLEELLLKLSQ